MPFFNLAGVPRTVLSVVVIGSGAIAPGRLSLPDPTDARTDRTLDKQRRGGVGLAIAPREGLHATH